MNHEGSTMKDDAFLELERARYEYRLAMRRYGEAPSQATRLDWMRAQRRLAIAVSEQLNIPL
ncbi:MAG: hypothetical protein A2289_00720 [Deltaproteobacteria bacterium RIFOXYA12_FULL_58_15]|nr:MAG: hypothetical protein A2289_00720 [Deltaproteobacteria bacterium RIFOXYA12_FULL_58_15]OGR08526.1 MAG: hypothetical protein A2341_25265 [Deltaproteobacteria bacterium RIFOXYB12_FULL_58_9]